MRSFTATRSPGSSEFVPPLTQQGAAGSHVSLSLHPHRRRAINHTDDPAAAPGDRDKDSNRAASGCLAECQAEPQVRAGSGQSLVQILYVLMKCA